jgi:hypothetical protein
MPNNVILRNGHIGCTHDNGTIAQEVVGRTTWTYENGVLNTEAADTNVVARDGHIFFTCDDCGYARWFWPSTPRANRIHDIGSQLPQHAGGGEER